MSEKKNHKHLTLEEAAKLASGENDAGTGIMSDMHREAEECGVCSMRVQNARYLFKELKKMDSSRIDNLYNAMLEETKSDEDIFAFISNARASKTQTAKIVSIKRKKPFVYIAAGLAAACLLIALNFFYYAFLPEQRFMASPVSVLSGIDITRRGFLFGEIGLKTQKILQGKDRINTNEDITFQTEKGMKLFIKNDSEFSFKEEGNKFIAELNTGRYFIDFDKYYKGKMAVELPMNAKIMITGTKIYFDVKKHESKVYMYEGSAEVEFPDGRINKLTEKNIYIIKNKSLTDERILPEEQEKNILNEFTDLNFENETDSKVDEVEKKQKSASSDMEKVNKNILQPQFKAIAVLAFRNNIANDRAENFRPWEYGFASMIVNDLEAGLRAYNGKYKVVNIAAGELKISGRPEELRKIAVSTGADYILAGSFSESKGNLKLETQIFTSENGTRKGTASVSGKTKDFAALEKELGAKIFRILGFASGEVDKKIRKSADTKSVEASLNNYKGELGIKNAETLKKKGKTKDAQKEIEKARESFEKAVKADPEYEKAKENLLNMPIAIPVTL